MDVVCAPIQSQVVVRLSNGQFRRKRGSSEYGSVATGGAAGERTIRTRRGAVNFTMTDEKCVEVIDSSPPTPTPRPVVSAHPCSGNCEPGSSPWYITWSWLLCTYCTLGEHKYRYVYLHYLLVCLLTGVFLLYTVKLNTQQTLAKGLQSSALSLTCFRAELRTSAYCSLF